jgi:hypothetical protein
MRLVAKVHLMQLLCLAAQIQEQADQADMVLVDLAETAAQA